VAIGRRVPGVVTVRYEVIGVGGIGEVRPGDDVAALVLAAAARQATPLAMGDLVVISQKIVSKAEGRLLRLADVTPSSVAVAMAAGLGRDPRLVEVILRESRRVVRMDRGVLVTETHHGWVCANAGVDQSNVDADTVALLPEDPDRSARGLRERFSAAAGGDVAVIVADTFGRPWREGLTNIAIGVAGFAPLKSYLGERDPAGRPLQATILALADELASAAEPVMGKLDRVPAAIIRGLALPPDDGIGSKGLLRDPARDLFR
jgi:coenzyme F420-0:L-glutamate ligase / coenzyme F420-1:gamma-L-glutamate ligase